MTDTMRRLTVDDCIALIGEDSAFVRDGAEKSKLRGRGFDSIAIHEDPLLPAGVIEIRDRDRVVGRIFAGGAK